MPINPHDVVERFSCDSSSDDCMLTNCDGCGLQQGDEIISVGHFDGDSMVHYEWKNVNRRVQKSTTIDVEELVRHLNEIITVLKCHIHIKHIQYAKFNSLKSNLQVSKVLIQIYHSETYANQD